MKIVQISTGFDILFNGGVPNYVRNLSEKLEEDGQNVYVIYSYDNGLKKSFSYECIPISTILHPFHRKSVIYNKDIKNLERLILELNPDIIHVHMMIDLPVDVLKMFKKHAKLVITLHDYSFLCNRIKLVKKNREICHTSHENRDCNYCIESFETVSNRVIRKLGLLSKQYIYKDKIMPSKGHYERFKACQQNFKQADLLIAVSTRVKEIYENNGFTNPNFVVNHIGNYTAEDKFRSNFLNKKKISTGDKINFGFIGSLVYTKGAEIFLKIVEKCNHQFHIYGEVEPDMLEKLKSKKNVYYYGPYHHNDLINILKNIQIGLVLPIWEDNAPQVMFEFLNANIPIVGTRMGGLPDFINEKNGLLFNPNNDEIEKIIEFINSEKIYEFYNTRVNNFSGTKLPKQHSSEIIELYKKLLQ